MPLASTSGWTQHERRSYAVWCCMLLLCSQHQLAMARSLPQQPNDSPAAVTNTKQQQQQLTGSRWQALVDADLSTWNSLHATDATYEQQQQQQRQLLDMQDELQLLALMDADASSAAAAAVGGGGAAAVDVSSVAAGTTSTTSHDALLSSEAEVDAAAAAAIMAAVFSTAAATTPAATAAGQDPQHGAAHQQQQQLSVANDSGDDGDDAAAQAAVLASLYSEAGSVQGEEEEDVFHDDEAEAELSAGGSSTTSVEDATPPPWAPLGLDAPVPKNPTLYAPIPLSPISIVGSPARAAARKALDQALQAAGVLGSPLSNTTTTQQGSSSSSLFDSAAGLSLEDKLLLARLLGMPVRGEFDEAGRLDPAAAITSPSPSPYWDLLDRQLQEHPPVKHLFESTWYKCGKLLAPELAGRSLSPEDLEQESQRHIMDWLGIKEAQLPRSNEVASFDELVDVLSGIGATARIVTDPIPFLTMTRAPLDRNGIPMLIHMTLKDKGRLSRHHMLAISSWARHNPDHTLLLYDDADLLAYMRLHDTADVELYLSLTTAVERTDLWRYLLICRHGGVYTDADTVCVQPIQAWNSATGNDASVLIGVEDIFKRNLTATAAGAWGVQSGRIGVQFEQWTLAGAPNHPAFCSMPELVRQRVDNPAVDMQASHPDADNWHILHRTGPHVWTDSVLQWMNSKGVGFYEALVAGGKLVANDTRVMPAETFGCPTLFFNPKVAQLDHVYAMHMFRGAWRKRPSEM